MPDDETGARAHYRRSHDIVAEEPCSRCGNITTVTHYAQQYASFADKALARRGEPPLKHKYLCPACVEAWRKYRAAEDDRAHAEHVAELRKQRSQRRTDSADELREKLK